MDFDKLNVPTLNIIDYDRVIHLSHVDLDGFSCSLLTHNAREGNIEQMNAQYGKGVDKAIDELVVKGESNTSGSLLILITDLSLNEEQCARLDAVITGTVDVKVIDHHPTQGTVLEDYSWYYQNADASATALLYDAIRGSSATRISHLEEFVKAVSAYDTFDRTNETLFASGSAINNGLCIFLEKLQEDDEYTRHIAIKYLEHIAMFTEMGFISRTPADIETNIMIAWRHAVDCTHDDTVADVLVRNLATRVLEDRSNRYEVKLDDVVYRCVIVDNLPFRSVSSYEILNATASDVDFVIIVSTDKGTVAVRSKEAKSNELSREYFGGWGHTQAAGGKLDVLRCDNLYTAIEALGFVKAD